MIKNLLCNKRTVILLLVLAFAFYALPALANEGGVTLPWTGPLEKFVRALSGWQAVLIGVLAAIIGAVMLIMQPNGDYGQIFKIIGFIVLAVGIMCAALPFLQSLFGKGALL